MNLALFGRLLEGFQGKQGSIGGEGMKQLLEGTVQRNNNNGEDNPRLKELLDNPLEAIEKNEKLKNAVAAQGKIMGWDLLPTTSANETPSREYIPRCPNTDIGEIELNQKIILHQPGNAINTINILMFGKSGCGQTTLLSYLTENDQLEGTDSMSTQHFSAETFQLPSETGMTKIRINESPGMCSGFEIPQLQEHWNHLISRMNEEGGVSVFLLLIKSNERITSQLMDEIEEFSELYFDDREEFWKSTVVVFTSIDELKGCDTLEDRVSKLETQIAKPGMEKVKKLLGRTSTECIYVSSIDHSDKRRFIKDLTNKMNSIAPDNNLLTQSLNNLAPVGIRPKPNDPSNDETLAVHRPLHVISSDQFPHENSNCEVPKLITENRSSNNKLSETLDPITVTEPMPLYTTESLDCTKYTANQDETEFLPQLSHQQLLLLVQEICKDRNIRNKCRKTRDALFPTVSSLKQKKQKKNKRWFSFK